MYRFDRFDRFDCGRWTTGDGIRNAVGSCVQFFVFALFCYTEHRKWEIQINQFSQFNSLVHIEWAECHSSTVNPPKRRRSLGNKGKHAKTVAIEGHHKPNGMKFLDRSKPIEADRSRQENARRQTHEIDTRSVGISRDGRAPGTALTVIQSTGKAIGAKKC